MPTKRTPAILFIALLLYLFANQTQVGWLYVMSALLAGVVAAAWALNRRALRGLAGTRQVGAGAQAELYEGDEVAVRLALKNPGRAPMTHVRTAEICPLADPESAHRNLNIFIPALPAGGETALAYDVTIYRRGLHEFPPLALESRAPFGFFRRKRTLAAPARVLVYPELRPLRRLNLLDRQPSVQLTRPRAGAGTEVIGVRPYRTGDSPRHIHWRSVARTGQLISKEFVDESRPGVTVALDLFPNPYPDPENKHHPFEWAVKIAASIGDYAQRRGYALHLLADETAWPPPSGPLSRLALLEYLARVQPTSMRSLAEILETGMVQTFLVALLPWPNRDVIDPLIALRQRGVEVLAILLDPASFPTGDVSAAPLAAELRALDVGTRLVAFGQDWRMQIGNRELKIENRKSIP